MGDPSSAQIVIISALINAAVTWGVISTKLAWLRRDVDDIKEHLDELDKALRLNK